MRKIESVVIRKIQQVNPRDRRGPTYEWCKSTPGMQVSIYHRRTGSVFGEHYHKGIDPSKNPERFFVVAGKARLRAYNGRRRLNVVIREGTEVLISPYVYHSYEALTDFYFIEYRSTVFDRKNEDSFDEESYQAYLISRGIVKRKRG